jgi:hypothetical protein
MGKRIIRSQKSSGSGDIRVLSLKVTNEIASGESRRYRQMIDPSLKGTNNQRVCASLSGTDRFSAHSSGFSRRYFICRLHRLFGLGQPNLVFLAVLFISLPICFAQKTSQAILFDEFEKISNDPLQWRVYNFMQTLDRNDSRGYVVTYGTKENPLAKYFNERRIQGCLLWMKYDLTRFSFIFTEDKDKIGGQFWEIPEGGGKPELQEMPHDYKLTYLMTPQIIDKLNVADEYCPLHFDMQFYARFLNANPNIFAKIIIYQKTANKYQKEKLKYLRELTGKENVAPRRIKFVRGKYYGEPDAEFWLEPLREKKKNRKK